MVQATGNAQFGGTKPGLARPAYHSPGRLVAPISQPMPTTPTTKTNSCSIRHLALLIAQLYHRSMSDSDTVAGEASPVRKIIHIDMDAFYASVEQRDNPELRGKPVAVGGSAERGVVAAASYEARNFGVRSAMASITAKRQCPDLIFVKPRFEVYKAISRQIREIFAEHTEIIEPLSLDEAYLDVTENLQRILLARDVALAIRTKIKEVTGLNASAGISYNRFFF